jgi:O-phosphoseryl-tRNA synthetase
MGKWNSKEIVKEAKVDFEKTWERTKDFVISKKREKKRGKIKRGSPNLIFETISKLRRAYLKIGFDEIINPLFIEDTEVHKQFGPEAVAVLDRVYYLGGLPRPDIGISERKFEELKRFNPKANKNSLERILRWYKKGEISGDDLIAELALVLKTDDVSALKALDTVFPEFKDLKPVPSTMTLRSHMTSAWFLTLQSVYGKREMPINLFSIDRCFRREQQEDSGHLRTYHSASCVVLDESFTLDAEGWIEEGMDIVKKIYKHFKIGIQHSRPRPDVKRSKYYAPDTQFEVFGHLPSGEEVEVATMGLYSPTALSRYGIEHPVLNIGIGVERITMVTENYRDIRELVYPQFYSKLEMTDPEISKNITLEKKPTTKEGKKIARNIFFYARRHASAPTPCEFEVYNGPLHGKNVKISLVEIEEGTKLLGPAALNKVVVYEGNIFGVSESKGQKEVLEKGTFSEVTYLSGIAYLAAWEIEKAAKKGERSVEIKIKGVKLPSDVNLKISDSVNHFITSNHKKIDIRGPVFTTIEADFS